MAGRPAARCFWVRNRPLRGDVQLRRSREGVQIDALDLRGPGLSDLYLIVNRVDGLESGSYLYRRDLQGLELLRAGRFNNDAVRLACGQSYAGDVHVAAFWLADLAAILQHYGDRGYRLAQFEAAFAVDDCSWPPMRSVWEWSDRQARTMPWPTSSRLQRLARISCSWRCWRATDAD